MSKEKRIIALILYLISIGLITSATLMENVDMRLLWTGYLIGIPSWLICLWTALKNDQIRNLWFFFLFFMSGVAIPIFLLSVARIKPSDQTAE